jgi:hypothetical protein
MGISTLIKTLTASNDASLSFVDGASDVTLDSTYDEYMFVFTDIGPATDAANFTFQVNATDDAGGGYDTSLITSTYFMAEHYEDDSGTPAIVYKTALDLAQSASFQPLAQGLGNGSDESCAGILHLFSPASTTFVKHFYSTFTNNNYANLMIQSFVGGYINDTTAIDEIQFKMSSGNFDGVIQLFGIS